MSYFNNIINVLKLVILGSIMQALRHRMFLFVLKHLKYCKRLHNDR